MTKPRLIIPITYQFSVRYVIRTGLLNRLAEFCQPVVVLAWHDESLCQELGQSGIELHLLPESHFGPNYLRIRRQIDSWHLYKRVKSISTPIDERVFNKDLSWSIRLLKQARTIKHLFKLALPGTVSRLFKAEQTALQQETNITEFEQWLPTLKPDALFSVTPYHRQEELLLRAVAQQKLPRATSIISFDNLTTRGWIPILFDHYMIWNRYNEAELYRTYPETTNSRVDIVGPAQFDFYWDDRYLWSEKEWRQRLGLPEKQPVILYAGGPQIFVPHEPHFLQQLDDAISNNELPDNPVILFRRHPMDPIERWQPVLKQTNHVIYDDPWPAGKVLKYTNVDDEAVAKLASTLSYSQVHLNVCSTMALDGAIFDKPQIAPAYDDRPGRQYDQTTRILYQKEHYQPLVKSGGVDVVYSRAEMINAVKQALRYPELKQEQRKQMVREICTFTDGQCTERIAHGIQSFLHVN